MPAVHLHAQRTKVYRIAAGLSPDECHVGPVAIMFTQAMCSGIAVVAVLNRNGTCVNNSRLFPVGVWAGVRIWDRISSLRQIRGFYDKRTTLSYLMPFTRTPTPLQERQISAGHRTNHQFFGIKKPNLFTLNTYVKNR